MGFRTSRRSWRIVALGFSLSVLVAACGARWTDDQRAAVLARAAGSDTGPTALGQAGSTASSIADVGLVDPSGVADPTPGGPESSAAAGATGPGTSGPRPCEAPSDAPGVTDTDITVGSISTLTGPVPGLGATGLAAMRSYVAYRNATGGVCNRKLVLRSADDGTDNARYRSLVDEFNPKILGLVGGTAAGDAGGAEVVVAHGMPVVSATFSVEMGHASTAFDISPAFKDVHQPIGKYDFIYRSGVRQASIVTVGNHLSRSEAVSQRAQMEASGIHIAHYLEVPLSTLSWDAPARAVANSGADFLLFIYDPGTSAAMARALEATGYDGLKFAEYITAYGSDFIDLGGAATEGSIGFTRTAPNEDAVPTPTQAAFLRWMAQVTPGSKTDTFAADGWSAATAFFEGIEALPGPITREGLIAQLNGIASFDAGGLLGPINLGESSSNGCGVWMQVVDQRWQRLTPAEGFLC